MQYREQWYSGNFDSSGSSLVVGSFIICVSGDFYGGDIGRGKSGKKTWLRVGIVTIVVYGLIP